MTQATKLVVGCGYLGQRVARSWKRAGDRVVVATRRPERAAQWRAEGYDALVLDVTDPDTLARLPPVDTVLYAVAYDRSSSASREVVCVEGLQNLLDAISVLSNRLIYISTTGVYGDFGGAWIDERSPCQPDRDAGRYYVAAEERLRAHRWGAQAVVLRLAGIYGPQRVPYLDLLRNDQPLPVDAHGYLNLIHVDDAVEVIEACQRADLPNLYVVSDGVPVKRCDYYEQIARCIGRIPRFGLPDPSSPQAQRALSSKRIRNDRLVNELRVRFTYPSYREGLRAILQAEPRD